MEPAEAQRRVEAYRESGFDPRVLWDGVTGEDFVAASREIARVSGSLLAESAIGARASAFRSPGSALADGARLHMSMRGGEPAFAAAVEASGMGALLGRWVTDGRLDVPAPLAAMLAQHLVHGRRRAARLRDELRSLLTALRESGIEPVVLKGMFTGAAYFPEPGTRPCADIDLLVAPREADGAGRILAARGLRPFQAVKERATWSDPRAQTVVSLSFPHEDNPWSVDLHTTLDRQFRGRRAAVTLGAPGPADLVAWDVDGVGTRALAAPMLLAHLALHASNHLPRLSMVRLAELALVLRRHADELDWEGLRDRLASAGALPFTYPAFALADALVPGCVPSAVLGHMAAVVPARVRRLTAGLRPETTQQPFAGDTLASHFVWSASWRNDLAVLADLCWPRGLEGHRLSWSELRSVMRRRLRRWRAGQIHLWHR